MNVPCKKLAPVVGLLLLLGSIMFAPLRAQPITSANELIRAAHDRYHSTWYQTLSFVQRAVFYAPDGTTREETWYEAAAFPGKLRIDVAPLEARNTTLMVNDSLYQFRDSAVVHRQPFINPLSLVGFDLYFHPVEETLDRLATLGVDTTLFREDTWQDRSAYVVGAASGDLDTPQFWMDQEHLYFMRWLQPTSSGARQEIQFNAYQRLEDGWIAPKVQVYIGDRLVMLEEYSAIRANPPLDPALFDPDQWHAAPWHQ